MSPLGYGGVYDYLAQRGKVFESQPLTEAEVAHVREVLTRHRGERFPLGNCYENSMRLALNNSGIVYVVGLANTGITMTAHAWVSLNGKVIDLTCLKAWNPVRSARLSRPERVSLKAEQRAMAALYGRRIDGRLGIYGTFPSHWFYIGEEFVDADATRRFEVLTGYTGTALRSKWLHPDPEFR